MFSILKKEGWNRWLEFKIINNEDYVPVLSAMIASEILPDENTIIHIIEAYRKNGDIKGTLLTYSLTHSLTYLLTYLLTHSLIRDSGMMEIYEQIVNAEDYRQQFRYQVLGKYGTKKIPNKDVLMNLPPPSKRIMYSILEILRDNNRPQDAVRILEQYCARAKVLTRSLTYLLTHLLTYSITHSLTHSGVRL